MTLHSEQYVGNGLALLQVAFHGAGVTLQDTATVSLGCGQSVGSSSRADPNAGAWPWVVKGPLMNVIMQSPADIQTALGEYLLMEQVCYVHVMLSLR